MDFSQFKLWADAFKSKVKKLMSDFQYDLLKETVETLEKKTYEPSFWDDKDKAQAHIKILQVEKDKRDEFDALLLNKEALDTAIELFELGEELDLDEEVKRSEKLYDALETHLILNGPYDRLNAIIEIHPGAGGTESQDWASMLFRMYQRFSEMENFSFHVDDYLDGTEAGLKRATITISGKYSYGLLKAESGVHRLVRISPFDSGARRHTSFASVNVIPELEDSETEVIPTEDLKIDTYRSSGAGGQSVNTTDSAVRITHIPTGVVVTCQNERSQIKNRAKAMQILQGKLFQLKIEEKKETIDALKNVNHSNAFGSQIRSYVMHPYSMVKDHRTSHETSQVQKVLDGDIIPFIYAELKRKAKEDA